MKNKIEIEPTDSEIGCCKFFKVREGNRFTDLLTFDEMLGLVASLTMSEKRPHVGWMKTQEEWDARAARLEEARSSRNSIDDGGYGL